VSFDADMQTVANSLDVELLASVTTAQSACNHIDSDESPSDADSMNNDTEVTHDCTLVVTFATALHDLDNLHAVTGVIGLFL